MRRNKVQLRAPSPEDLQSEWLAERLADVACYLISLEANEELAEKAELCQLAPRETEHPNSDG